MSETTRNTIVGLTTIAGLVVLGYLIIIFGQVPQWVTPSYRLMIHLDDASGIASGTRVRLNGIDIGYVDDVKLKTPSYKGVTVLCQIEKHRQVPLPAIATASAGLLGGAAQLNIRTQPPPEGSQETFIPTDGTGELVGQTSNLGDEITRVASRLEADLHVQLEKIGAVADEFATALQHVNELLEKRDLADVDAGKVEGNLRTTIVRLDQRLSELKTTTQNINALLNEEMREQVRGVVSDVRGLAGDAREKLGVLTDRFVHLTDELSKTLATTNALLGEAKEGKGTLGRFVQDPQLYNALVDAANRMTDTLNEAKLLIQKWKAEGVPFKF